ncbi:Calx-beta domain-containing protein [Moorena producens]|uniref:Calx-beta domain-containing protein n=1 Tax=Moorena producens TaxID=1155739 RepID=UPI003C7824FD
MQRTTSVSLGLISELTVAGETVNLILEKIEDRNVTVYQGGMIAGQRLYVVALLEELIPELDAPDSIQNLAITKMAVELRPDKGAFSFEAAIENAWSITLDSGPTLSIQQLALSVSSVKSSGSTNGNQQNTAESLSQQRKLSFEGLFELFGGEFAVKVAHQFSSKNGTIASQWGFSATAQNISITEVIKAFGFSQDKLDEYGLRNLVVSLAFALQQTRYQENSTQIVESRYTFTGSMDWDTGIALVPGEETLQIQAAIQITKTSSNRSGGTSTTLKGAIAGTVKASIPFFDTLQLSVIYTFSRTSSTSSSGRSSQALANRTGELIFQLQISTLLLSAVYTNINNRKLLRFSVSLVSGKNPTIGDLIAYIVSVYDSSINDFELDPPWDEFAKQEIALDKFSLEIDLTNKSITISYKATLNVLIAKVSNVGLSYQFGTKSSQVSAQQNNARTASNKKIAIAVDLSIPGQPKKRVQWDPVNENPPEVPSTKAPIFELKFLALGQRVAFAPEIVQQARTIEQFTTVMRQTLVPLPPIKRRQNPLTALLQSLPSAVSSDPTQPIQFSGQPIQFSAESGWLIGAQFVILGSIEISVIFNDPFIYGLRISLSGPPVQSFAGFEFEILYRRISDTVGVYRSELVLPDTMRYIDFGAVHITLPVVAIEIYTNGDFGIDVGFPWGGDFSRSIAVNVTIFLGLGGFYFNKLSAETATSVPDIVSGTFDPVLEFGIGLQVGLGKIIKKGPLRAEFSITMHGLLQGVFATYNPTDTNEKKATYYRIQGGVAIVGRIYGVVDFKVIQVDIEVLVKVAVLFVVEVYKAIQVALVATVSVKASIKIAFVRIRFKFKLTVREQFVLGSDRTPPWQLAAGSGGAMAATIPVFTARAQTLHPSRIQKNARANRSFSFAKAQGTSSTGRVTNVTTQTSGTTTNVTTETSGGRSLRWDDGTTGIQLALPGDVRTETVKDGKLRLDIYFQPSFTKTETEVSGIGLLFMENSIPLDDNSTNDNDTDFDELVKALFKWVIYAYLSDSERNDLNINTSAVNVDAQVLTLELLEDVYTLFVNYLEEEPADEFWAPLIRFLSVNFIFDITDRPIDNTEISGTIFPMFPQLQMELKDGADTVINTVDFDSTKYSPDQIKAIQTYFQSLNYNHNQSTEEVLGQLPTNNASGSLAIAELLFIDYFTLIIRSAVQLGIDHVRDKKDGVDENGTITLGTLLNNFNGGESFQSLAGMTSRFLLHGLRIPTFTGSTTTVNGQQAAYIATGQQFTVTVTRTPPATDGDSETVTITPNEIRLFKPDTLTWIRLIDDPSENSDSATLTPELNYPFPDSAPYNTIETIKQLDTAATSGILPTTSPNIPTVVGLYNPTNQQYTIRQKTYWNESINATSNNLLWELPSGLCDYLKSKSDQTSLTLLYNQQPVQDGETLNTAEIDPGYTWATKLTLEIRQVSTSDGSGFLPTVYAIERIETASRQLLQDILTANVTPTTLTLLYLDDSGDSKVLTRNSSAEVLMLKTNLSLDSGDNRTVTLDVSTTFLPFLRLVQESTVVNSEGYYLNYSYTENDEQKGLPDSLFADGDTAQVTLLMTFSTTAASYHNCLNIPSDHSQSSTLNGVSEIFATSSQTTNVLRIPAGNLGFRLTRTAIEPQDNDTATDEIQNLYQLLSYQVPSAIAADFETGQDRLPIGPIEEDEDNTTWVYEKVLPVYALTTAANTASQALPEILKDTLNPYYGIGDTFTLDFRWQDIYGNRLGSDGDFAEGISQKLGYFDPILGINQWPSVGESYRITSKDDKTANLILELVLDQSKYIPTPGNLFTEVLDQIKTDRATYQQIYYQVHDSNLTFTVSTSVIPSGDQELTDAQRAAFTGFVDNVYKYLVTLEYLQQFSDTVAGNSENLESVANQYGCDIGDLGDSNSAVSGIFTSGQTIQIPVGIRVEPTNSLNAIATKLNKDYGTEEAKVEEIVTKYAKTADLLAVGGIISYTDSANHFVSYTVQDGDTFESIAIAQLALEEDHLIETLLQTIAQGLDTTETLTNGVLIKGLEAPHVNNYVTLNATLEEIAYGVLQLENADLDLEFDQILTDRINEIIAENESTVLLAGVTVSALDSTTQDGETLGTLRDRLLAASQDVVEAIRDLEIFPTDTTLTVTVTKNDEATPTPFNVEIKVITDKTWSAIATAFPNTSRIETVETVILANAQRQDLLVAGSTITMADISLDYTIQAQDSLYHIALNQFVATTDARSIDVLKSGIVAEVGALEYTITEAILPERNTLAYLTQQLHLQTNLHRTVLETVQAVGNISDILTESAIASQLVVVAAAVSDMTGLFGTEDVILADVLFNYTVTSGDSFDQMIAIAAAHDGQIITDQTTAGDIALQTPSLALESGATLYIPDRFTLDTSSAQNADSLAVVQSTDQTTSLSTLTSTMGTEITPAAVAIANQTLAGLLSGNAAIDVRPVLASLTKISYNSDNTVNSDLERLAAFIDSQTIQTGSEETFYTLTSRWALTLVNFKNSIDAEASQAQQSIGAVNAIYEQLDNLTGANRIALRALLDPNDSESSLSILKATLLDAEGNLKPQFEPSTVHSQPETLDVPDAIANIETAHGQPDDQVLIDTLQTSLDIIHRMYDFSCLKTAVDLLEKRSQRPLTVAEVGQALQNESGLIEPLQNWIVPPAVASTTVDLTIRDNNNSLLYPTDLLFSVTVQLEMRRNKDLMHPGYVPEAEVVSAYFAPKTVVLTSSSDQENAEFSERLASLDPFAKAFEQALPNLKLAVGRNAGNIDNANPQNSDTLWAVHLGDTGISYDIKEDFPYFFSAAPLSNTLMSGEVSLYSYTQQNGLDQTSTETVRVDAVDLNGLARNYLRAIEDILKPETAIPAVNDTTLKGELGRILDVKASLANSISNNVTHVLDTSVDTNSSEYTTRQTLAVAALQKELLTNLADAYDIETIVQYNVDVAIADGYQWSGQDIPRLSGQPVMSGAYYTNLESTPNSTSSDTEKQALLQSIDFTLSPAKISLSDANNGKSTLTFFFNTQTPQRYEDIAVNLNYQVNELEYNINTTNSTSSWLNFIQPLNDGPNQIGDVQIPIPLRDFPLPPSLISHTAIPDPDSFAGDILSAEDIRDWNYVFLYEHPDVAQDTIECRIEYNGSSKLTINDVSLKEPEDNQDEQTKDETFAVFTVTLSPPSDKTVTVDFKTQDGTAKAGQDYAETSGTLEFATGETTQEIRVPVNSDDVVENNETFTIVLSNAVNAEIADPVGVGTIIDTTNTIDPLLDTLVRFNNLYPTLASDLKALETGLTDDNQTTVTSALSAFATLAEDVARSWQIWQPIAIAQASRQTVHYNIDENLSADEETKTVIITPTNNLPVADQQVLDIELPGYELNETRQNDVTTNSPTVPYTTIEYDFTKLLDATGVETFGESALPDRKVTVTNLDVLDYQNAWGAIRLARNKNLIDGRETNAAFIFQTPEVRFKNRITPLIVNDKHWDIADLGDSRSKTLTQHLEELFKVLLPAIINRPYDIRISCQYAFALASNTNDEELLASLPVILTPRFTVQKSGDSTDMLAVTQQLRTNIVREIDNWQTQKNPNQTRGRYLFSFSFFSNPENVSTTENPNLPLLTVENLNLLLTDIIEE